MVKIYKLSCIVCKRYFAILAVSILSSCYVVFAQTSNVSVPYVMSFENTPSEVSELTNHWMLNAGTQASLCTDRWCVGSDVHSDGSRALYIVNSDSTTTPLYGKKSNLQFAYRDFKLPAGSYYVSFDWMNAGDASAALYVGYVGYTNPTMGTVTYIQANSTNGSMPSALTNTNCSGALYGQSSWQSYTFPRVLSVSAASTTTYRFYVAWSNKGSSVLADSVLSACVDNIQIVDSRVKPASDIKVTSVSCDTLLLSWSGSADAYVVEYRAVGTSVWHSVEYDSSMGTSALVEGLNEGSYDFRVRTIMYDTNGEALYGAYAYYSGSYLVYCADRHCLSYFDLTSSDVVCTYGKQEYKASLSQNLQAAYSQTGIIDYGADSKMSRHTVCWDKSMTDPRTGDNLRVVPANATATVRLGNWDTDAEAEAITYTMTVDSASCILLLHYAVVLEDPDHAEAEQPRFTIELKDAAGNKIDETCGYINFAADYTRPGWHTEGTGYNRVTWKDWTTVGLHLGAHVGKTITISLATYDCTLSGHYGYAYFWLDCASATITSSSCGQDTHFSAQAPEGFLYRWTNQNGDLVSTTRQLDVVSADSAEYTCRLTNTEQAECWFELKVLALPRFPIADGTWSYTPIDCRNRVTFHSRSFVETRHNGKVEQDFNKSQFDLLWTFDDGSESPQSTCTHDFPSTGGRFPVTLTTWLADGSDECSNDTVFYVVLPAIGDTVLRDTVDICDGTFYEFGDGRKLTENGDYTYTGSSDAGCEVEYNCHLRVHETHETKLDTAWVCYGDTYCLDDTVCYASDKSGIFRHKYLNRFGCDSVVIVDVSITDPILPTQDVTQMSETVDEATVRLGGTGYTYYTINNGNDRQTDLIFATTEPGDYLFTFYNDHDCSDTMSVYIKSPCLRNLLFQRWNDIIAIYNNEYLRDSLGRAKDTLTIVSYQWYKDETPIEGATASYYCAPNGLEIGASYSCSVLLSDSTLAMICPLVAEDLVKATPNSVSVLPNLLPVGTAITIYTPESGQVICLDALGNSMCTLSLESGYNTFATDALSKGFYLLQVLQSGEKRTFRICLQ